MTTSDSWNEVRLGQHASLLNGFAFPSEGFIDEGGMPLIRIRDLRNLTTAIRFCGSFNSKYVVHGGDLLIGMDGDFDTVKWKGEDALLNQRVCKLVTNDPGILVQDYLFYRIIDEVIRINRITAATTVKHLSSADVLGISFELPPEREQSKIAEVLSTVDRAIEQTEALIAKQQRIKTGLMQDLLARGIDEQGNLRSEQTHEFKDSPLGRIPVEWNATTIGDQFAERTERGRAGLPVMSIVMNDGLVKRSAMDRRVETTLAPEQHALVGKGDIAYNMMRMWQGVLGRASFDCLVSPAYVVLRPLDSIDSRFAQWLFRDLRTVQSFRRASRGVVDDRLRLYPKDLFPIPMAIPKCRREQSHIADRLDAQLEAIQVGVRSLAKLLLLKRGLMQDMLTGNRRVTALLEPDEVTE